jgi:dTDP-4-amino-4,6-dideoxygalactose transaminase
MKIRRAIPPAAAPISLMELVHGFLGIVKQGTEANLEKEMKKYFGIEHAFLVSSGKAALFLILSGLNGLTGKRKVVIPAYTCFSVPSAIRLAGLEIVLCDVEPGTLDFDYSRLKELIDDDTLCVIPTHLFGVPADIPKVREMCEKRKIFVVEDAAQAMGAVHEGKKLGTSGDVGFFSLARGKNITCGSGGIIVTSSEEIAASIRTKYLELESVPMGEYLKNILEIIFLMIFIRPNLFWLPRQLPFLKLGETRFYRTFPVRKFTGFQAGLLYDWNSRLVTLNRKRSTHADHYMESFGLSGEMPIYASGYPYNRFPVYVGRRSEKDALCESGHWSGITPMYPFPVHRIRELKGQFDHLNFEGAETISNTLVTLPTHALLKARDTASIHELVRSVCPRRKSRDHDSRMGVGCH